MGGLAVVACRAGVRKTGVDVLALPHRMLAEDFFDALAGFEIAEHCCNRDAQSADGGAAVAEVGDCGDAGEQHIRMHSELCLFKYQ